MAGLISVRGRKYSNLFSLVPFANNVYTTNKIWRSQPKSVRTGNAWLTTNSTLQADGWGTKRSIRKTEKSKHTKDTHNKRARVGLPWTICDVLGIVQHYVKFSQLSHLCQMRQRLRGFLKLIKSILMIKQNSKESFSFLFLCLKFSFSARSI